MGPGRVFASGLRIFVKEVERMAGFWNAVSACVVLLMLMSVGYFMGVWGWLTSKEKKFISKFIVNIAVPCNCLVGLLNNLDRGSLIQAGGMVLAGVLAVVCSLLLSALAATLLRLPRERWGVFVAMAGLSNTIFIGIPVCTQLFGEVSMPYIMLYYLGHTSFLQSVGVMLVERAGTRSRGRTGAAAFFKDLFSKPPILSVLLSILLLVLDLRPPATIMKFASYISGAVSPLALIYCGFIVYEVGLKNLHFLRGLPTMLVMRLALSPVICLACCSLLGMEGLPLQVFVVESALPVVSQVPVMAGEYGADEKYAATGSCLSILASFLTIPVLMLILS